MSSIDETGLIETPTIADSFVPTTDEPLTEQEAFDRLQTDLTDFPTSVDLVVTAERPEPIGRSWAFDWALRRFVKPSGALGPKPTIGVETLQEWIEKVLNTARGAHPVHPANYGLVAPQGLMFGASSGEVPPDLEDRVVDALTFHPHISSVEDFAYDFDPDDEWLAVSFTIILDNNDSLALQNIRTNLAL